jgi:hypothetical protein
MVRLMVVFNSNLSNQAVVLATLLIFNVPVLGLAWVIVGADVTALAYVFVAVNCFGYFYFHLFNMTETARRIKILCGIHTARVKRLSDLKAYYSTEKALELRLERLEKLSQIRRLDNGTYLLHGRLLYYASLCLTFFRRLLGFES